MTDSPFNEEVTYRAALEKRFDDQDKTLGEILKQTRLTNGRDYNNLRHCDN